MQKVSDDIMIYIGHSIDDGRLCIIWYSTDEEV